MTRPISDVRRAQELVEAGWPLLRIANELSVSRATIRSWRDEGFEQVAARRQATGSSISPSSPHWCGALDCASWHPEEYAYLLGQYLGDGHISRHPRGVFRLRIFCCSFYPGITGRCVRTARAVLPTKVSTHRRTDCEVVEVSAYWKHLPCLFPQHGPGRKHERPIYLAPFQQAIVEAHPERFVRGLIESDGCRVINRVNGSEYPRYMFTNASDDIRSLFCRTVEQLGCTWTTANARNIAISRRPDVELLDSFIGPKR